MYFEVNRFVSELASSWTQSSKMWREPFFCCHPKKKFRNNHSYPMAKPSFVPHLQGSNKKCGWAKTSRFPEPNKGWPTFLVTFNVWKNTPNTPQIWNFLLLNLEWTWGERFLRFAIETYGNKIDVWAESPTLLGMITYPGSQPALLSRWFGTKPY